MLDMLRMLCMLCVLHVLCMLSTLYGCPEADSIGRDGDLRCTEWGLGGWAYRSAEPAQQRLQYPAAAAGGCWQCGRSQT